MRDGQNRGKGGKHGKKDKTEGERTREAERKREKQKEERERKKGDNRQNKKKQMETEENWATQGDDNRGTKEQKQENPTSNQHPSLLSLDLQNQRQGNIKKKKKQRKKHREKVQKNKRNARNQDQNCHHLQFLETSQPKHNHQRGGRRRKYRETEAVSSTYDRQFSSSPPPAAPLAH